MVCQLQPNVKPSCLRGTVCSLLLFPPALHTPHQPPTVPTARLQCSAAPSKDFCTPGHSSAPSCLLRQHRVCSCSQQGLAGRSGAPQKLVWDEACPGHCVYMPSTAAFSEVPIPTVSPWEAREMCHGCLPDHKRACCISNTAAIVVGLALIGP